jgi:hypothetical protein
MNGKHTIQPARDAKVWRSGGALFGAAGCWLTLDLLRRLDAPPAPDEAWVRHGFPAAFNRLARELGATDALGDDREVLVGAAGRLWWCGAELAMVDAGPYAAIGSGERTALGALFGRKPGRAAALHALAAAAHHCPSVCGPFAVVSL